MMTLEARFKRFIERRVLLLCGIAIALLGLYIRYAAYRNICPDMEFFYIPWLEAAQKGGMRALIEAEFSYSPLFMYLWALLGKVPLPSVALLKAFAAGFECLMTGALIHLAYRLSPPERRHGVSLTVFALLWLSPILILGASAWGQTDMAYALFAILAAMLVMDGRSVWAMVCLGISLSFKLQAVFVIPAFAIYYFCGKGKLRLWHFLIVPAVWIVSGVPMALFGESPLYAVTNYFQQAGTYSAPVMNYPNIFALLGEAAEEAPGIFNGYGMAAAFAALLLAAGVLISGRVRLGDETFVLLCAWCVLSCVFFLPHMHDRYALVGETLLALWCALQKGKEKLLYLLPITLPVLSAYCFYLFGKEIMPLQLGAFINLGGFLLVTATLFSRTRKERMEEV